MLMPTAATATAGTGTAAAAPTAALPSVYQEVYARDAMIAWFKGEFAAANAIIDALCGHLAQIGGGGYEGVFATIHRRRMNWIPVLHMQKYFSIGDVAVELQSVAERRNAAGVLEVREVEVEEKGVAGSVEEESSDPAGDSPDHTKILECSGSSAAAGGGDSGSGGSSSEDHSSAKNAHICADHENCDIRRESIKICKGFVAKEPVKGHMVNVVKGLKVYEDIFTDSELLKLGDFINELRTSGRNGELSGDTFIFFNKQLKGNKREIIQLGVPIFQPTKDEATSYIEPIPSVIQDVIDHLVQWRLITRSKKPNSCIINFFDEGEHSQPYFKPPHLDNPISTLVLHQTTMAFGRALMSDHDGNYKGSLTLSLKEGSLVVMRGHSADMARHVVSPSPNTRVTITFIRVQPSPASQQPDSPSPTKDMSLWKPEGYGAHGLVSTWGVALQAPIVMVAPPRPIPMNNRRMARSSSGTGVFLPWTVGSKKYIKQLPPRIQKRRLPSPASPLPCVAM